MNKNIVLVLSIIMVILCTEPVSLADSGLKVYVNGYLLECEVTPIVIQGVTMVPVRPIAEAIGVSVIWDKNNMEIKLDIDFDRSVLLHVGSNMVIGYGRENIELEVAPFIKSGRTYVPLPFISECFDKNIEYDEKEKVILVDDMVQDAWFIDKKNNYKIKMFEDMEFERIMTTLINDKPYSMEISITPFYSIEDLSLPVLGFRESFRITLESIDYDKELKQLVDSYSNYDKYKIVEKTDSEYLIYYEYNEGDWTYRQRIVNVYIKYDKSSILVSEFDAVDSYYKEYGDKILENLKTIQDLE